MTTRAGTEARGRARRAGLAAGFALVVAIAGLGPERAGAAEEACFQQCWPEKLTGKTLDDFTIRDAIRGCRDLCEASLREKLAARGDAARWETCTEKELTPDEILRVRQASGIYTLMLTTFVWDVRNVFPDRVLRSMEVRHLTPTMMEVGFSARTIVPPGERGTFVMFDVNDLLPQMKHSLKVTRLTYCDAE